TAEAEPVVEAKPVVEAEPAPEPTAEAEPVVEAEPAPESTAEAEPAPEPTAEAEPVVEPESAPEPTAEAEPAPEPKAEAEPPAEEKLVLENKPTVEATAVVEDKPAPPAKKTTVAEVFVDDHEERNINDSYDDDVDHEDKHETQPDEAGLEAAADAVEKAKREKKSETERVNYALLSKEDLVKMMRDKLDNPGKGNIRKEVDEIRQVFTEKQSASFEEKKSHFLEEGGTLEDFKPATDPAESEMRELLNKYRSLKAEYTRQLEKTKQENLIQKQHILEELRILMEGQETFEITFRKFKELQRKWFAAGVVPQQNLKDLWDSYNYFVEKFNDYVSINRDLRTLDLKKNLEMKTQLCERTEELDKEPNIVQAFKTLQKLHTRWREIGPVPRDNRDEIWDRFKLATSVINRKHQDYHSRLKNSLYENLEKKEALSEKVEAIAAERYDTHGGWAEKTSVVLELQKTWKTIGYAPKKDNNAIYARFRKACDIFFGNKAAFYSAAFEEQKDNLKKKYNIVERAESLSNNQDWKATTTELIRLQKEWKEIGPVPRRDSDKLWRRFRAACDAFFNNKSTYFDDIDSSFDDNLKSKEEIIKEMEAFKPVEERKDNMVALSDFQARFDKVGYVPSNKKEWIREQFRQSQDKLLEKIGMDESERSIFRFRNRIKGMLQTPRSEMKLNFERDKLVNKLQQLRSDISVWENNIGFFKLSESSEGTLQGFHEKINSAHERIKSLEMKIRILDDMENAN
ncbi:MAG: DUF349 domain-containing protein, partial [Bacteroidetes bacterium]|nr:DUF349 domain-containing protein [Bacteroidota bacterium]